MKKVLETLRLAVLLFQLLLKEFKANIKYKYFNVGDNYY